MTQPLGTVALPLGLAGRVSGQGGAGVLWLHAHTLDSSVWGEIWPHLPDWHHLGIDLPGHGDSTATNLHLADLARHVCVVAAERNTRHLVGHSLGSLVALAAVRQSPGSFDSLTLASPLIGAGSNPEVMMKRYREIVNMYRIGGPGEHIRGRWMDCPPSIFDGIPQDTPLWDQLRDVVGRHGWNELLGGHLFKVLEMPHPVWHLRNVSLPTLVLVGQHDLPATRRAAMVLGAHLPAARIEEVPEAGHLCLLQSPEACADLVASHLQAAHPS